MLGFLSPFGNTLTPTTRSRFNSLALALALILPVVIGIVLRTRGLERSLWQDEAWVANSVLASSWHGMFFYDAWLQTSPPLFLVLVRSALSAYGLSDWSLRLIPFLCGAAACIVMWVLIRRLPAPGWSVKLFMIVLFALSPTAIAYSYVLKQYGAELLSSTGLLLVTLVYVERQSWPRFLILSGTAILSLLLGYGTVLFLPVILVVVSPWFLRWWNRSEQDEPAGAEAGRWWALCALAAAVVAFEYVYLIIPNSNADLENYWRQPIPEGLFGYVNRLYSSLFELFHHLPLPRVLLSFTGARIAAVTGAALLLPAVVQRTRVGAWRRDRFELLALAGLAALTGMIAAELLRVYPLVIRTSLPMLPSLVLVAGYGVVLIKEELIERLPGRARQVAGGLLGLAVVSLVAAGADIRWNSYLIEDLRGAVAHLKQNVAEDDTLYVHASSIEGYKLYTRMLDWEAPNPVFGEFGWPCCPRPVGVTDHLDEAALRRDLSRVMAARRPGKLWVLHAGYPMIWNSLKVMEEGFRAAGCTEDPRARRTGIAVRSFSCPPPEG